MINEAYNQDEEIKTVSISISEKEAKGKFVEAIELLCNIKYNLELKSNPTAERYSVIESINFYLKSLGMREKVKG